MLSDFVWFSSVLMWKFHTFSYKNLLKKPKKFMFSKLIFNSLISEEKIKSKFFMFFQEFSKIFSKFIRSCFTRVFINSPQKYKGTLWTHVCLKPPKKNFGDVIKIIVFQKVHQQIQEDVLESRVFIKSPWKY